VVVDDVWEEAHAAAFDCLGPEGVLLITSRFDGVVSTPPEACVKVDVLEPPDGEAALAMLRSHAREEVNDGGGVAESKVQAPGEGDDEAKAERAVLRRCGGLPLAIAIAGSLKRSLEATWGEVLGAMESQGIRALTLLDSSEKYSYEGLWEALGASVAHLKSTRPKEYECLLWYGAFMEDTWVPLEIVWRVWGMGALAAKGVLRSLAGRSLIELDVEGGWRSQALDLLRDFLQAEAREAVGEEGVRRMHGATVRQGLQASTRVSLGVSLRSSNLSSGFEPYFGREGLKRHLEQSGEDTVGHLISDAKVLPATLIFTTVVVAGIQLDGVPGGSPTAGSLPSTPAT
jgi:hypothetical protein